MRPCSLRLRQHRGAQLTRVGRSLQIWHHASVVILFWSCLNARITIQVVPVMANSLAHIFVYGYFCASSLKVRAKVPACPAGKLPHEDLGLLRHRSRCPSSASLRSCRLLSSSWTSSMPCRGLSTSCVAKPAAIGGPSSSATSSRSRTPSCSAGCTSAFAASLWKRSNVARRRTPRRQSRRMQDWCSISCAKRQEVRCRNCGHSIITNSPFMNLETLARAHRAQC